MAWTVSSVINVYMFKQNKSDSMGNFFLKIKVVVFQVNWRFLLWERGIFDQPNQKIGSYFAFAILKIGTLPFLVILISYPVSWNWPKLQPYLLVPVIDPPDIWNHRKVMSRNAEFECSQQFECSLYQVFKGVCIV